MDHEKLQNVASAVQSFVVTFAVLVGGGWTLYTYVTLRQKETARLEQESKRLELETKQLELPVVDLDVSATELAVPGECRRRLHVRAVMSNGGTRSTKIRLAGDGLAVYAVSADSDPETSEPIGVVPNQNLTSGCVLRPNGKCYAEFTLPVPKPGLYYAVLRLEVPEDEAARVRNALGLPKDTTFAWVRGVYVSAGGRTSKTRSSSRD